MSELRAYPIQGRREVLGGDVRNFDLKAEAEMRLHSDRLAEELARERSERPTTAADDTQGPGPADGPSTAGTAGTADAAADDDR